MGHDLAAGFRLEGRYLGGEVAAGDAGAGPSGGRQRRGEDDLGQLVHERRVVAGLAAVAAEGSLSRAAERLFVSQPALTRQIKQLEGQLGVQLFTRSRAGMTLTAAGQALSDRI